METPSFTEFDVIPVIARYEAIRSNMRLLHCVRNDAPLGDARYDVPFRKLITHHS